MLSPVQKFRIVRGGLRGLEYDHAETLAVASYYADGTASHPHDFADYTHDVANRQFGPCNTCEAIKELANREELFSISFMDGLYEVCRG